MVLWCFMCLFAWLGRAVFRVVCWVGLGELFSCFVNCCWGIVFVFVEGDRSFFFCLCDCGFTFCSVVLASSDVRHHAVHGSVFVLVRVRALRSACVLWLVLLVGMRASLCFVAVAGTCLLLRVGLVSWVSCGLTSDCVVLV